MAWRFGELLEHRANNRFELELVRSCGGGVQYTTYCVENIQQIILHQLFQK